jgi:hypothetical protein
VSWRNEIYGTWLGTALALAFSEHAYDRDLFHILSAASKIIEEKTTNTGAKQSIECKYLGWSKVLYFNPGVVRDDTVLIT